MPLPPPSHPPLDLAALLPAQAERFGQRPFLRLTSGDSGGENRELSWAETEDLVARVAGGLLERGHGDGSTIVTAGGAPSTQLAVWFACHRIGATWAPLNPLLRGAPLAAIVGQAKPDLLVTDSATGQDTDAIKNVASAGVDDLLTGPACAEPPVALSPELRAKLMFTSGTTGNPKGVVWNRRCEAVWAGAYANELLDVDEGDGIYTCLPLAHVTAQGTVLAALARGAILTLADGFSPFTFWDQIRAADARRFTFVGTILSTLARAKPKPTDRDHNIDRIVGAGAPPSRWHDIEARFGVQIMETWGQTESAGCYTMPRTLPQRPGSIGRPTERFEVHLDDPSGGSELLIRPTALGAIFDGYLRPDSSLESPYDNDGWYHTGDLIRRGGDGDLEFVTRQRESIRRRGEIIPSAPIEDAALTHHAVTEAAAVAVPAGGDVNEIDEEIKLCVVLAPGPLDAAESDAGHRALDSDPGEAFDPAELHRHLREQLPGFMVPRWIEIVTALPKTPSTRVQKFKLGRGVENAWDARRRSRGTSAATDDVQRPR